MKLKKKKPIIYAQDVTEVPSGTEDIKTSRPATYGDFSGYLPNIYGATSEEELKERQKEDPNVTGQYKSIFDPKSRRGPEIGPGGFDAYASLYNLIQSDVKDSAVKKTGEDFQSLYENPVDLYQAHIESSSRGEPGTRGFRYSRPNIGLQTPYDKDETGYMFNFGSSTHDLDLKMGKTDLSNIWPEGYPPSGYKLKLNSKGEVTQIVDSRGLDRSYNTTREEFKELTNFVKDYTLKEFVTGGLSKDELGKYRTGTPEIETIQAKPLEIKKQVPTFVESPDIIGKDIEDLSIKGPEKKKKVDVPPGPPPPPGPGEEKKVIVPSGTEEGFSIGGVDYPSEAEAKVALKKKPQSQLSDEEYDFLYSYAPATQEGAHGMKLNKYKGGGITLKKNK